MDVEIVPEPTPDERAAILAALREEPAEQHAPPAPWLGPAGDDDEP